MNEDFRSCFSPEDLYWIIHSICEPNKILDLVKLLRFTNIGGQLKGGTNDEILYLLAKEFNHDQELTEVVSKFLDKICLNEIELIKNQNLTEIQKLISDTVASNSNISSLCRIVWAMAHNKRDDVKELFLKTKDQIKELKLKQLVSSFKSRNFEEIEKKVEENFTINFEENGDFDEDGDIDVEIAEPEINIEEEIQQYASEVYKKSIDTLRKELANKEREIIRLKRREKKYNLRAERLKQTIKEDKELIEQLRNEKNALKDELRKSKRNIEELEKTILNLKEWTDTKEKLIKRIEELENVNNNLNIKLKEYEGIIEQINKLKAEKEIAIEDREFMQSSLISFVEDQIKEREHLLHWINKLREDVSRSLMNIEREKNLRLQKMQAIRQLQDPRVGVFVDVQNMFYAARKRYNGKLNYQLLLQSAVRNRRLAKAIAYIIKTPDVDQSNFISLLTHCGYEVKTKDLKTRLDGSAKGDWDMEIAMDVISMLPKLDVVILVSGDGDFVALVKLLKRHSITVEVMSFEYNTSSELIECADRFIPIDASMIIES